MRPRRLLYYEKEWLAYPDAHRTGCSETEVHQALHRLCCWAQVPRPRVKFSTGRSNSQYLPLTQEIRFDRSMLSWLTVAHEFAHHWSFHLGQPQVAEAVRANLGPDGLLANLIISVALLAQVKNIVRRRWHDETHRQLVAATVEYIRTWKSLHGKDGPFGQKRKKSRRTTPRGARKTQPGRTKSHGRKACKDASGLRA